MTRMPYPGDIYPNETYPGVSQSYVTPDGEWEYVADAEEQRAVRDAFGKNTFSAIVDNPVAGATYTVDIGGVPGFYDDEFFDGAEAPSGTFDASWVGAPDDSISVLSADTVDVVIDYAKSFGVKMYLSDEDPIRGSRSMRVIPTSPVPDFSGATSVDRGTAVAFTVPASAYGLFSITVRTEQLFDNPVVLNNQSFNPFLNVVPDPINYFDGVGTARISYDITQSAVPRTMYLHLPGSYLGGAVTIDEVQFVAIAKIDSYFDGNIPDDEDVEYSWEGTPDNSRSLLTIQRSVTTPAGIPNPYCVRSTYWKHTGDYSLRILPSSSMPGAVYSVISEQAGNLVPGKTYTISAVRMMEKTTAVENFPDTDVSFTGNIFIMTDSGSFGTNTTAEAGVRRISTTFVMPETSIFYIFFGGAPTADVWWDSLIITDGTEAGTYFDGFSSGAEWLGIPYESTSRMIPIEARDGGYPLKKLVSVYGDRMGDIDEIVARLDYLPEDVRSEAELYNLDLPNRVVPLGATSDLVDARTADDAWMPWIGQLLGINPRNMTTDELRTAITSGMTGMVAGTRRSIAGAVKSVMTGPDDIRSVRIYPHTVTLDAIGQGTEWDLLVVTPVEQGLSLQTVRDAVERAGAKPSGVIVHHISKSTTWADLHAKLPTWAHWNDKSWMAIEEAGF